MLLKKSETQFPDVSESTCKGLVLLTNQLWEMFFNDLMTCTHIASRCIGPFLNKHLFSNTLSLSLSGLLSDKGISETLTAIPPSNPDISSVLNTKIDSTAGHLNANLNNSLTPFSLCKDQLDNIKTKLASTAIFLLIFFSPPRCRTQSTRTCSSHEAPAGGVCENRPAEAALCKTTYASTC